MIQPTSSAQISPKIHQKMVIVDNAVVSPDAFVHSQEPIPRHNWQREQFFASLPAPPSQSMAELFAPLPATNPHHTKELTIEPLTNPDGYKPADQGSVWSGNSVLGVDLLRDYNTSWNAAFSEQFFADPKLK